MHFVYTQHLFKPLSSIMLVSLASHQGPQAGAGEWHHPDADRRGRGSARSRPGGEHWLQEDGVEAQAAAGLGQERAWTDRAHVRLHGLAI